MKIVVKCIYNNYLVGDNMKKTIKAKRDSWIDIDKSDENLLGRKRVDFSTFSKGTTIQERYHKVFTDCLSKKVKKGESIKVKLVINNEKFNGAIRWTKQQR